MDTTSAQLYLADQRGVAQTDTYQRLFTFNTDEYVAEGREPFGPLYRFTTELIRPAGRLDLTADGATTVVLLPLVGGLEYHVNTAVQFLEPGQAGTLTLAPGQPYRFINPYEAETISFLHIALQQVPGPIDEGGQAFDLNNRNTLLPFFRAGATTGHLGLFGGRREGTYAVVPAEMDQKLFIYIVEGAFEVTNRLMHTGDGLALTYHRAGTLEFEALSNEALLVLLVL